MASNEQLVREIVLRARDDASRTITRFDSVLSGMGLNLKNLERQFLSLPSAIGIGLSAGALVGFGNQLLNLGDQLSDLSDRTGISIGVLGGLRPMLEQDGSSVEAFAKGIVKAQKALGLMDEDSAGAAQSLKLIGLSVSEIRQLSPEEFLEKFARGLATVENRNDRVRIATDLFSKSGAELIPTLLRIADQGLPRLSKEAEAGFKALGKLKDALVGATAEAVNFWAALFGKMAGAVSFNEIDILNRKIENLSAFLVSMKLRLGDAFEVDPKMIELQAWLAGLQVNLERLTNAPKPAIQKLLGDPAEIKKAADAYRHFQDQLEKQLSGIQSRRLGLGGGEQAALAFQLDEQLKAFKDKLSADKIKPPPGLEKFFAEWKEKIMAANVELRQTVELLDRIGKDDADVAELGKAFDAAALVPFKAEDAMTLQRMDEAAARAAQDFDDMAAATREWAQIGLGAFTISDQLTVKLQDIDREAELAGTEFDTLSAKIEAYKRAILSLPSGSGKIAPLREELEKLKQDKTIEELATKIGQGITQGITQTIQGIAQGTLTLEQGLKNMLRNVLLNISQFLLEEAVMKPLQNALKQLLQSVLGGLGGSSSSGGGFNWGSIIGSIGTWIGSFFATGGIMPGHFTPIQAFASGGVVSRPTFGMIGEGDRNEAVVPLPDGRSIPMRNVNRNQRRDDAPRVSVTINGDITPRQPGMKPSDVIKVFVENYKGMGETRAIIRGDRR